MSTKDQNTAVVLKIFTALETRDPRSPNLQSVADLIEPDVEFQWPTSLPYGGTSRGMKTDGSTWLETWSTLQPTEAERRMDPRVVAVSDDEVVVLWRQRGICTDGHRFEGEVLGVYTIRNLKLARAQMFYFDTAAVISFLAHAKVQMTAPKSARSNTDQRFVIIFKRGQNWIAGKSVWEQRLHKHLEYMQKLFDRKKLFFAGPFLDDQGGLSVLNVSSEDEAKNILAEEPATQEHIFEAELHALRFTFDATTGMSPLKPSASGDQGPLP
jgi:ketosteroid isomerase-like protein/uncharacterized protein YciI